MILMVTDAGLVTSREKVTAIAGTGQGSDTALVMQAASTQHIKRLRVNEIICRPLERNSQPDISKIFFTVERSMILTA